MNVYFVDECIYVAADSEEQAIALCEKTYGDAPGATAEMVSPEKVNEITIIDTDGDLDGNGKLPVIYLKELFANAVKSNTPRVLIDIDL